jgi:replicative DNA helicase
MRPLYDEGLEKAVLGTMLLERSGTKMGLHLLKSEEAFYKTGHKLIFRAMQQLFTKGTAIDLLTVMAQVRQNGDLESVGGAYELSQLPSAVNSAAHLEHHVHYLLQLYTLRKLDLLTRELNQKIQDPMQDPFELISSTTKGLTDTLDTLITKRATFLSEAYAQALADMQANIGKNGLVGVPSGISSLDKLTGGWQRSALIIIAARPAMGKTAVALQLAKNAALMFKKRVALFSLEMSTKQLTMRLIASEVTASNSQLSKAQFTLDELATVSAQSQALNNNDILLDDTPGLSITELRTKALKLKADHDIELLIVDYLQLMRGESKGNREQEIGSISRGLKLIAKELDIPVIALSQLSRAVEARGDKKPMLSDLRESGSIEQDADDVIFLYRPEYYNITEDEEGNPTHGTLQWIYAKHRNGPTDTIITGCDLAHSRVFDLSERYGGAVRWDTAEASPISVYTTLPESKFEHEKPF